DQVHKCGSVGVHRRPRGDTPLVEARRQGTEVFQARSQARLVHEGRPRRVDAGPVRADGDGMIQATCTCGWTMAGPPADSWELDEAVDEHSVWCPENDWVNDELEGQRFERDRIIGRIRATFSPECADHIVDVITRNMTNGTGNPAKSSPDAAQDQTTSKEIK